MVMFKNSLVFLSQKLLCLRIQTDRQTDRQTDNSFDSFDYVCFHWS